ncbi:MAG: glycosyltransferase family 39 protein [Candidatus Hodarchaeales archaeon]
MLFLIAGAGLRFYGIQWGLPYTFHPDEKYFVVDPALKLFKSLITEHFFDLEISSYGPLPFYLLLAVRTVILTIVGFKDSFLNLGILNYLCEPHTVITYTLNRSLSALFGTLLIFLVLRIGTKLYGSAVGLLSACFVTFSVGLIQASHFGTVDIQLIFFLSLTFLFAINIFSKGDVKNYIFAGISLGLTIAIKFTGIILLFPILVSHLIQCNANCSSDNKIALFARALFSLRFLSCLLTAFVIFLILSPHALFSFYNYFDYSVNQSSSFLGNLNRIYFGELKDWTLSYVGTTPYLYHISNLLFFAMGYPLELVSIIGTLYVMFTFSKEDKVILALIIPLFLIVGAGKVKTIRFILPLIPFIAITGARFLVHVYGIVKNPKIKYIWVFLIVIILSYSAFYSFAYVNIYSVSDSRIQAQQWFFENVKPGAKIVIEDDITYLPPIKNDFRFTYKQFERGSIYTIRFILYPYYFGWENYPDKKKKRLIFNAIKGADYIVTSERHFQPYLKLEKYRPVEYQYYNDLFSRKLGFKLIKSFDASPNLFGINFNEDRAETFFKVFDHPKILIFKRTED